MKFSKYFSCGIDDKSNICKDWLLMWFHMLFHMVAGVHVFSNSAIDEPWQKVIRGRETFEQIVSQHGSKEFSADIRSAWHAL